MITVGSVSREQAASVFEFLAPEFRKRRAAVRAFTHTAPEFVFWISPEGTLLDARNSHKANPPKGFEWILKDEPDYGGFLRGRVARRFEHQLIVVYCRPELLANQPEPVQQLLSGLDQMPIPIDEQALVVSDNGDLYGTVADLRYRIEISDD
ncbi:MAG: hypothetical protein HY774_19665 [Acidobacteria bacterium]|nr:hypothetical protein [Acidobacteriota bacterium]